MGYTNALSVVHSADEDIAALTVIGSIDIETVETLKSTIDVVLAARPRALVLDLSGVEFLASAGIECLVQTRERPDLSVVIVGSTRAVVRPLMLTRLDRVLTIVPTIDQAREVLRPVLDQPVLDQPVHD